MKKIHDFDCVHDTQAVFRIILTVMSNPLKVKNIKKYGNKLFGRNKGFLAIAMTLIDNEVKFNTCKNKELEDEITSLTLAKPSVIEDANFIFVEDIFSLDEVIKLAKFGSLEDPQKSATIIIKLSGEENLNLKFYGAGINDFIEISCGLITLKAVELRDQMNYEYPQGIDFIFLKENEIYFLYQD